MCYFWATWKNICAKPTMQLISYLCVFWYSPITLTHLQNFQKSPLPGLSKPDRPSSTGQSNDSSQDPVQQDSSSSGSSKDSLSDRTNLQAIIPQIRGPNGAQNLDSIVQKVLQLDAKWVLNIEVTVFSLIEPPGGKAWASGGFYCMPSLQPLR